MVSQDYDVDIKIDRDPENKQITANVIFEGKHLYSTFEQKDDEKENDRLINREIIRLVRREAMKKARNHINVMISDKFKIPTFTGGYKYKTVEEQKEAKAKQDALYQKQHRAELNEYQRKWYAERKKKSPIIAT